MAHAVNIVKQVITDNLIHLFLLNTKHRSHIRTLLLQRLACVRHFLRIRQSVASFKRIVQ
ncbi:hypothetical protein EVA_06153 [gut metagenome]|uniref:Uncharacterized protein n=1 Tax=gut metagenome TaxID=749906 RepID=J9GSU5_9ZZZZ